MTRNDWNTPFPHELGQIKEQADFLAERGMDVHTVTIVLNGYHGGWDVTIHATDEDMEDHALTYILERYGSLEATS